MSFNTLILAAVIGLVLSLVSYFTNLTQFLPLPLVYFLVAVIASVATALFGQRGQQAGSAGKKSGKARHKPGGNREQGTVKWFSTKKGFGFITRENGDEIFVHFRSIAGEGRRSLRDGQRVSYSISENDKGLQAEEVSPA